MGDSIFVGIGASRRSLGCAKLVQANAGVPVFIIARTGYTTEDALSEVGSIVGEKNCSHVVVQFGNNDCRGAENFGPRVPLDRFESNLREILTEIRLGGKVPLVLNLPRFDSHRFLRENPELSMQLQALVMDAVGLGEASEGEDEQAEEDGAGEEATKKSDAPDEAEEMAEADQTVEEDA